MTTHTDLNLCIILPCPVIGLQVFWSGQKTLEDRSQSFPNTDLLLLLLLVNFIYLV